jgi:hypothetical protein
MEKSYRSADVLDWCLRSPFPSRFLQHAVCFQNKNQLNLCRFLFADATRYFRKQPSNKSSTRVYRGMKLSAWQVDQFEEHVGQLVCTSGFFPCMKGRTNAMALALLPIYRPDLSPVLFKIDCESTDLFTEISNSFSSSSTVVFDICMAFRVMRISRDQLTIIELKPASKDGKQIAQNYLATHNNATIESVLDQLLKTTQSLPPSPRENISTPSESSSDEIR